MKPIKISRQYLYKMKYSFELVDFIIFFVFDQSFLYAILMIFKN